MELIYTRYHITDPEKAVAFSEVLGFEKRRELPIRNEAVNIFMGLPGDGDRLELTYNFGVDSYELRDRRARRIAGQAWLQQRWPGPAQSM